MAVDWNRLGLMNIDLQILIKIIFLVLIVAPHVVEPFLTLATVYEDMGQKEKLYQVTLHYLILHQLVLSDDFNISSHEAFRLQTMDQSS